jgi:hypothetical protein
MPSMCDTPTYPGRLGRLSERFLRKPFCWVNAGIISADAPMQ